jgi:hypothetical protein
LHEFRIVELFPARQAAKLLAESEGADVSRDASPQGLAKAPV